jgi:type VI secretion system secreted protein VgrG
MQTLPANIERYLFEVSGSDEELRVLSFGVTEGISQLFSIDLEIVTENDALDFEQIIGQAGILTIQQYEEEEPRYFHGIISRLEQGTSGLRFTTYSATVVPKIWYLMHRHNCRIFQQMSVRDIVQKILSDFGLPGDEYQFVLQSDPPKREYCVQYRESEFDFISRLLEEEGIFYFFEHHNNKHILVMGDSISAHKAIQGESQIIFHEPRPGQVADEPHIYSFNYTEEILSGKVTLKDYNFKKPALNLKGEKTGDKNTELEVYDYPGKFDEPGRGNNLAKVRLEEYQTVKKEGSGATTCTHFAAGFFFTMEEYPRDDFNKKYLITQHQISGSQPQVLEETAGEGGSRFSSSFECIPFEVPYRPDRVTPKPVVEGSQTAIVVGPQGEEIYTNEHGQVKVQFHWDREGQMDEKSSCWIRVSQLWAGRSWGAMYIPRIGQEVIVDFLEGDPDRPIITGRVYHGTNKPPYPLHAEKTKSTIKSDSSKGGGGSNEFRFEDKKGQEEVYLHGQKDWNILIENDKGQTVGHDETLSVGNNRTKTVGVDQSETIGSNKTINVGTNHTETIGSNMSLTVGANETETVAIVKALSIGAAYQVSVGAAMDETIGGGKTEAIKVKKTQTIDGPYTTKAKTVLIDAEDQIVLKAGKASITLNKNGDIIINGGGKIVTTAKKDIITTTKKKMNIKASQNIVIKGKKVLEN